MNLIGKFFSYGLGIMLVSCSLANVEDLRVEGESQTRKLALELREIESIEALQKAVPRIKKRFNKLADLLMSARNFSVQESEPSFASEQLFAELARLYEMPGGKELIESAQAEAVQKLLVR